MTTRRIVRPVRMPPTNGYSHPVVASGPLIAISGQVPRECLGPSQLAGSGQRAGAPGFGVEVKTLAVLAKP